jgi:hypothetical protein
MTTELLQLDSKVTEDFINGIESSNGPTRSTGAHETNSKASPS